MAPFRCIPSAYRIVFVLLCVFASSQVLASSPKENWRQFRDRYPYHIQTIAVSDPDAEGRRTLLITEPPPHSSVEELKAVDGVALESLTIETQTIGSDGWVKDIVVDLPPMSDAKTAELLDALHVQLFGTAYKAYAIKLSDRPVQAADNLNLHVTSADLATWLLKSRSNASKAGGLSIFLMVCLATLVLWLAVVNFKANQRKKALMWVFLASASMLWLLVYFVWGTLLIGATVCLAFALFEVSAKKFRHATVFATIMLLAIIWAVRLSNRSTEIELQPILGGSTISCDAVLAQQLSGVFLSTKPGLVVWAFPRHDDLEKHRIEARQFALDSDLLLGAVASDNHIAVIGRERVTPVSLLPPLRTETMMLLAAANEDELGQSFERQNPFAGRYNDQDNKDWAPIYLSPRLINTEYGSLLNITDQMLKSWSLSAKVRYVNFNYPDPSTFPFKEGLTAELGHPKEIVFNWNTRGAGYINKTSDREVFALNKTGALPIDYLANGKPAVQSAEDTAYEYYGNLNDPNLVRVVEYAGLYQLFHYFGVHTQQPEPSANNPQTELLVASAGRLLEILRQTPDSVFDSQAKGAAAEKLEIVENLRRVRNALREIAATDPDHALRNTIARAMVDRQALSTLTASKDEDQKVLAGVAYMAVQGVEAGFGLGQEVRASIVLQYLLVRPLERTWIRTPSVVISTGQKNSVGGHNLYSRVPIYQADSTVSPGKVAVEDMGNQRVIRFNPVDDGRIEMTVRGAVRDETQSAQQVETAINTDLPKIGTGVQKLETALGFAGDVQPEPLRGLQSPHIKPALEMGWAPRKAVLSRSDSKLLAELAGNRSQGFLIVREPNGDILVHSSRGIHVQASDLPTAADGLLTMAGDGGKDSINVHFRGFESRQAEGFLRSVKLHRGEDRVFVASLEESMSPEELRAFRRGEYKLAEATVDESKVTVTGQDVTADVSIPHIDSAKPSLLVRIKLRLAQALSNAADFLGSLRGRIQQLVRSLGEERDLRIATGELFRALKKDSRFKEVHIQVTREGRDVFYAWHYTPVQNQKGECFPA